MDYYINTFSCFYFRAVRALLRFFAASFSCALYWASKEFSAAKFGQDTLLLYLLLNRLNKLSKLSFLLKKLHQPTIISLLRTTTTMRSGAPSSGIQQEKGIDSKRSMYLGLIVLKF